MRNRGSQSPVVRDEVLRVGNEETLNLSGRAVAVRRIKFGGGTAWYSPEDTVTGMPRPVKFDDGVLIYTMER